uniref:Uncharacterized AAA domain-containing protein ycf46 n=1 Tax=Vertebrata lanosa TaxID=1261582 RepID=A0A0B5VR00_9FLOR|nr:hypothetical protein [Vertebrata lanosa]AJH66057.1 hypothetical protein [Vertebrata lanosa]
MYTEQELEKAIKSNIYLIYIFAEEEERLEEALIKVNKKFFTTSILVWDFTDGYRNQPNSFSSCKQNPLEALTMVEKGTKNKKELFWFKDFDLFLNDFSVNRKVKNLHKWLKTNKKHIFLSGTAKKVPNNLEEYIEYIKLPLPNEKEIRLEVDNFLAKTNISLSKHDSIIYKIYTGFSIKRVRLSLLKIIEKNLTIQEVINKISLDKEKIIDKIEGLKFYYIEHENIDLGGLKNLKAWLKIRKLAFSKEANAYGIKIPKGILLVGIQGTGKSLSAKAIAKEWNLPLLKLDVGRIFASTLGESENRIEKVIDTCTAITPCILWIDEIDKIFTKQNSNDSGTTQRVTNIFLTWLSEKKDEIFIVATANRIDKVPIEMLRKGRFDEIFFVDLPKFQDRMKVFQLHLKKIRPVTWNKYNIYYFCKISNGFSGAEIEQVIIEAMYIGFNEKREFTSKDIIMSIKSIIPISQIHCSKVSELRNWGYSGSVKIA